MDNQIEYMKELKLFLCVDCGAYAKTKEKIKHYSTCKPGEAEYWAKHYSKEED